MRIKLVTIKEFGGRELPDEFIVPEVKIMAGIELARKFGIGETIIKKSGSSDISNALRPEEQISLFPPFRWYGLCMKCSEVLWLQHIRFDT